MFKSSDWSRFAFVAGAVLCFLAVAIGAFGAHLFSDYLLANQRTNTFELANRYQFYHGLALLIVGSYGRCQQVASLHLAALALFVGTLVFCGALYSLSFTNLSLFGAVAPIGGTSLLIGWGCLVFHGLRHTLHVKH